MKNKKIYLDYAATTPISPEVLRAMLPYLKSEHGNPSSIYSFGQRAAEAIEKSRERIATLLNCSKDEIIFTSSATEANNLAIFGLLKRFRENSTFSPHIITSEIEHHAILEPYKELEAHGVEATYLPVDKDGRVSVRDVENAIKESTVLVSVMYANNEIGTVEPISEIGEIIKRKKHNITGSNYRIPYFHTDAVQAVNYLDCNVENLGVDLLTLSGHKIYGPKGVGALYVKKETPVSPIILGGGQENNLRSGTENVAGIVGLGAAIKEVKKQEQKNKKIKKLRDKLIEKTFRLIPEVKLNGSKDYRLPNNVNLSFKGAEGEAIVVALDQSGIAVSTGSACSSRSLEPSHVLTALGLSEEESHTSLRITLGKYTTEQEINLFLRTLAPTVKKLREISGRIK